MKPLDLFKRFEPLCYWRLKNSLKTATDALELARKTSAILTKNYQALSIRHDHLALENIRLGSKNAKLLQKTRTAGKFINTLYEEIEKLRSENAVLKKKSKFSITNFWLAYLFVGALALALFL